MAAVPQKMRTLGFLMFEGFEVLDVYGPLEILSRFTKPLMISERGGPVKSTQGPATMSDHSFDDCPKLDWLLIPGGLGTRLEVSNPNVVRWVGKQAGEVDLCMTVCTGTSLLAKTGRLKGIKATSNKKAFTWVKSQGEAIWVTQARWVWDGKFVTSSGVSAGMDMAVEVVAKTFGRQHADEVCNHIEYECKRDASWDPFAKLYL